MHPSKRPKRKKARGTTRTPPPTTMDAIEAMITVEVEDVFLHAVVVATNVDTTTDGPSIKPIEANIVLCTEIARTPAVSAIHSQIFTSPQ